MIRSFLRVWLACLFLVTFIPGCEKRCSSGKVLSQGVCVTPPNSVRSQAEPGAGASAPSLASAGSGGSLSSAVTNAAEQSTTASGAAGGGVPVNSALGGSGAANMHSSGVQAGGGASGGASPNPSSSTPSAGASDEMTEPKAGCTDAELECDGSCVPRDARNCGSCRVDCTSLPNVLSSIECRDGMCELLESACKPGYAHCSDRFEDGCETDLSMPETCGGCSTSCTPEAPLCAGTATTGYACDTGCMPNAPTLCGGSCVDTTSDVAHCGACDMACPRLPRATSTCVSGRCETVCDRGYHDCDGQCLADSSVDSCGDSCSPCRATANASATCSGGSCGIRCNSGYHECDGTCRSNTSAESCGSRCEPCPTGANATASCSGGSCELRCNANARDCGDGRCVTSRCDVGGDCSTDSDCASGGCRSGRCVECLNDDACGSGEMCDQNRNTCVMQTSTAYAKCTSHDTCTDGTRCEMNFCTRMETSASACPQLPGRSIGLFFGGWCVIRCQGMGSSCPAGFTCKQNDFFVPDDSTSNEVPFFCSPSP